MTDTTQNRARAQAEARFTRPTQEDKHEAMAEYKAKAEALRERTVRLRQLRLAQEAKEQHGSPKKKPQRKPQKSSGGRRGC